MARMPTPRSGPRLAVLRSPAISTCSASIQAPAGPLVPYQARPRLSVAQRMIASFFPAGSVRTAEADALAALRSVAGTLVMTVARRGIGACGPTGLGETDPPEVNDTARGVADSRSA